jgi:hypothetical protein
MTAKRSATAAFRLIGEWQEWAENDAALVLTQYVPPLYCQLRLSAHTACCGE